MLNSEKQSTSMPLQNKKHSTMEWNFFCRNMFSQYIYVRFMYVRNISLKFRCILGLVYTVYGQVSLGSYLTRNICLFHYEILIQTYQVKICSAYIKILKIGNALAEFEFTPLWMVTQQQQREMKRDRVFYFMNVIGVVFMTPQLQIWSVYVEIIVVVPWPERRISFH